MLVFSGLGSLVSERIVGRAHRILPAIFAAIALILFGYALALAPALDWIGGVSGAPRQAFSGRNS